jgi:hypothetical protein
MIFKSVFRVDRFLKSGKFYKFNLFRLIYRKRTRCLKFALRPRLFFWQKEPLRGWNISILGIHITYEWNVNSVLC